MGSEHTGSGRWHAGIELVLGLGFLMVAAAVLLARSAPATGYERSIYAGTPGAVWLLVGIALTIAAGAVVYHASHRTLVIGATLGATTMTVVMSLPIVRGYHFFGAADSLTHLGWTRDLAAGVVEPHSLFYPAYHTLSLGLSHLLGLPIEHALLLGVVVLFVPFLVFVPLTVQVMTGDIRAAGMAAIASWMLLPVTHVATHTVPHTNTLALFYAPTLLFAAVAYVCRAPTGEGHAIVSPLGALLAVLSAVFVILHSQHAVNVLLVFGAICGVQFATRRYRPEHAVARHRPLYAPTALLGGLLVAWIATHETATRAASITLRSLFRGEIGAAAEVAQRSGSLLAIGAGVLELFTKLFLVSALFAAVTGAYLLWNLRDGIDVGDDHRAHVLYLTTALVPLTMLFGVYFLGTPKMAFRQFGFIFVLVTVVGGVAVAWLDRAVGAELHLGRTAMAVILAACLVVSLLVVFPSPFIYKSTPVVTEASTAGYGTAIDHRADGVPIATLNTRPSRYADAIYGTVASESIDLAGTGESAMNTTAFNRGEPTAAYPDDPYYAALTTADLQTELGVYDELNYDREGLRTFRDSRAVDRVFDNGAVDLYLVGNGTGA